MSALPHGVTSTAFVASNGELGWPREDIQSAIHAIRASGCAILGGEAWLITGPQTWDGLIPQRDGSPPGVYHWETQLRSDGESWGAYCARTARESIEAVLPLGAELEHDMPKELLDRLRFNVTYVAEEET